MIDNLHYKSRRELAGAPPGGRVHWLILHLPREFKRVYDYDYNYAYHNYIFYRLRGHHLVDVFIVKRTSKHYWRAMYCNVKEQKYECFGYRNTKMIAEYMFELYKNTMEE